MRRSRLETAIHIVLKGNPEATEIQIQKIHDLLVEKLPEKEALTEIDNSIQQAYDNPFEPFFSPDSQN